MIASMGVFVAQTPIEGKRIKMGIKGDRGKKGKLKSFCNFFKFTARGCKFSLPKQITGIIGIL